MITVNKVGTSLEDGIMNMTNAMTEDYGNNFGRSDNKEVKEKMWKEYATGFEIKTMKKFIKVINGGSVKAFIVMKDFKHFKMGCTEAAVTAGITLLSRPQREWRISAALPPLPNSRLYAPAWYPHLIWPLVQIRRVDGPNSSGRWTENNIWQKIVE